MEDTKMKTRILTTTLILLLIMLTSKATIAEGKNVNTSISANSEKMNIESIEEPMEIEEWMYSEYFNIELFEDGIDEDLEIEDWMVSQIIVNEVDDELEIEDWMINPIQVNNFEIVDNESELEIEDWMLEF